MRKGGLPYNIALHTKRIPINQMGFGSLKIMLTRSGSQTQGSILYHILVEKSHKSQRQGNIWCSKISSYLLWEGRFEELLNTFPRKMIFSQCDFPQKCIEQFLKPASESVQFRGIYWYIFEEKCIDTLSRKNIPQKSLKNWDSSIHFWGIRKSSRFLNSAHCTLLRNMPNKIPQNLHNEIHQNPLALG